MKDNFNETPHFPFTYGDDTTNNGHRLSDYVVNKLSEKKTQNYLKSMVIAMLALGSQAAPVNAIPPEYGEAAANIAQEVGQGVPPLGDVVGKVNPIPNNAIHVGQGQGGRVNMNQREAGPNMNQPNFGMPNNPIKVPAWKIPGPPTNPGGQYVNTFFLLGSIGCICLNASWGNPVFAYGCVGIVGGLINELRKRCL